MSYERESTWLLIGLGGAAVFMAACTLAGGVALGLLVWGAW